MRCPQALSFVALWLASAIPASAQVVYLDLFYTGYAFQTSEAPPADASTYYFSAHAFSAGTDDFGMGQLTYPGAVDPVPLTLQNNNDWNFYSFGYLTQAELLEAFPMGEYRFFLSEGAAAPFDGGVDRQVTLFPPEFPRFTDGTYTAFQGVDTSQDFTINFAPFDVQPGGNVAYTYVWVFSMPGYEQLFGDAGFQPLSSVVIPAGTLPPDTQFVAYVLNTSRLEISVPYPDPSYSIGFDLMTTAEGFTLPAGSSCPADFNQDGGIDGADVDAFFAAWENGLPESDVNQDGGIDGADVDTFFVAWENGGCG